MGLPVAMDDFGTGYSSLASLHELTGHVVRIGRCCSPPDPATGLRPEPAPSAELMSATARGRKGKAEIGKRPRMPARARRLLSYRFARETCRRQLSPSQSERRGPR